MFVVVSELIIINIFQTELDELRRKSADSKKERDNVTTIMNECKIKVVSETRIGGKRGDKYLWIQ